MALLVTGGSGFIGSNFILEWFAENNEPIINLDALTYAGNSENLKSLRNKEYLFFKGDINDQELVSNLLDQYSIRAIIHFAAESHVDRSIQGPESFILTNIVGTFKLLEASKRYWSNLAEPQKNNFRFIHISTDEVYGSLEKEEAPFTELNLYKPSSPYSASKASSDHLVHSYYHTFGLPSIITHCSNNYGPYQFPEKLIPLCIERALAGNKIPVYGDGLQIRDWLYVKDHCSAIRRILEKGKTGEQYNIGGWNEKTNLEVIESICTLLDEKQPRPDKNSYLKQIAHTTDRPGHDRRYAINASKIEKELNWMPHESFTSGLEKTIHWYLENREWMHNVSGLLMETL